MVEKVGTASLDKFSLVDVSSLHHDGDSSLLAKRIRRIAREKS